MATADKSCLDICQRSCHEQREHAKHMRVDDKENDGRIIQLEECKTQHQYNNEIHQEMGTVGVADAHGRGLFAY